MALRYTGFQSLLNRKFYDGSDLKVAEIARKLGLSPSTLYNYIEGVSNFPPDLIAPLYNVTKDPDFLNFILQDTDQMLAPRQKASGGRDTLVEAADVAVAIGKLVERVRDALAGDNEIDGFEAERIREELAKAHKELEDVAECLPEK